MTSIIRTAIAKPQLGLHNDRKIPIKAHRGWSPSSNMISDAGHKQTNPSRYRTQTPSFQVQEGRASVYTPRIYVPSSSPVNRSLHTKSLTMSCTFSRLSPPAVLAAQTGDNRIRLNISRANTRGARNTNLSDYRAVLRKNQDGASESQAQKVGVVCLVEVLGQMRGGCMRAISRSCAANRRVYCLLSYTCIFLSWRVQVDTFFVSLDGAGFCWCRKR